MAGCPLQQGVEPISTRRCANPILAQTGTEANDTACPWRSFLLDRVAKVGPRVSLQETIAVEFFNHCTSFSDYSLSCKRKNLHSWILWVQDSSFKVKNSLVEAEDISFPGGSDGKESACHSGDSGLIPRSGRPPGEQNGYPLQNSYQNSMDRAVHGVAKSRTRLSD